MSHTNKSSDKVLRLLEVENYSRNITIRKKFSL